MNQILMIDNKPKQPKKRSKGAKGSSGPIEIKNIIRFFAIVIIVFALVIISHSSYAIYVDAKGNNTDDLAQITITRFNDTITVNVQSTYLVNKFKYNWQDSEQTSIPEDSTSFQVEGIILPSENNVLTIVLEDETGRAVTYTKEIILDGIDIVKPIIETERGQGSSVIITATDETQIEYMTYALDDGEEIRIDKNNENDTVIEYVVTNIERGEHTLYVTAVDSFGNIETVETTVKISTDRPVINSIDVDKETGTLLINASDQDGLQTIEVNLNGAVYRMDDVNRTEAIFTLNLQEGTNTLYIKLTNVNGISAEGTTEFDYAK